MVAGLPEIYQARVKILATEKRWIASGPLELGNLFLHLQLALLEILQLEIVCPRVMLPGADLVLELGMAAMEDGQMVDDSHAFLPNMCLLKRSDQEAWLAREKVLLQWKTGNTAVESLARSLPRQYYSPKIRSSTLRIAFVALAFCLSAGLAQAEKAPLRYPASAWDPALVALLREGPRFLPRETDVRIPQAPEAGSATAAAEITILRLRQAYDRTPEALDLIRSEGDPGKTVLQVFADHGRLPDLETLPDLGRFLTDVTSEVRWFVLSEKWTHQRARPSQVDPDIAPALPVPGHAAYPSGHAAESRALAVVLARLDPTCAGAYLTLAEDIADRREIAGLHFPSDSRAGVLLADQIVGLLLDGPLGQEFHEAEVSAARWRAAEGSCPDGS